jgi:hypothetical protein
MHQPANGTMMNTPGGTMMNQSSGQELPQWPHAPTGSQSDAYNQQRQQSLQNYQQTQNLNQANAGLFTIPNNTTMNMRTISNSTPQPVNGIADDPRKYNSAPVQPPQTAPSNWGNNLPTIQPN